MLVVKFYVVSKLSVIEPSSGKTIVWLLNL